MHEPVAPTCEPRQSGGVRGSSTTSSTHRISRGRRNTWEPEASRSFRASPAASARSLPTASRTPALSSTSSTSGGGGTLTPTSASRPARPAASTWSTSTSTQTGSGFAAFEHARRAGFVEGWAWLVRTPSGGLHAYFLRTSEREQRSWQVPSKHIDFRGDGGYIIVPPSRVTGEDGVTRSYQQIAVAEHHNPWPVDANGLRGFLDPPRPMRPPTDIPAVGARPDKLAAWVASRPEGGRNGGLFWAACRMAEEGHDLSTTTSLLGEAAYAAGLPEREAMATIRSAYRIATRLGPANQPRPTQAVEAVGL